MNELSKIMAELGNRIGNGGYCLLYLAIEEAVTLQPQAPCMEDLCAKIMTAGKKNNPSTVYRSLARAVDDIWAREENRPLLEKYYRRKVFDKPTPKDFITAIARYLWECSASMQVGNGTVVYHLFETVSPKEYGIIARLDSCRYYAASTPFSADRERVEQIAQMLNQYQIPLDSFKTFILTGKLPNI